MPERKVERCPSLHALLVIAIGALATSACESDDLAPVSGFKPTDCKEGSDCGDDSLRLDAGFPSGGDATVASPDAGTTPSDGGGSTTDGGNGGADSGAGGPDASPPDSGPPPSQFLDLNGTWNTQYVFDLSEYFFGIGGIADEIDFIDQTFQGNIDTGFPPLDAFIVAIVQQFVPPWVADLVNALNTVATLFNEVYAYGGRMTITQDQPLNPWDTTTALHATETWQEFVILLIDQCPLGRSDPNFPACAERRIPVTHNPQAVGPVEILVEIKPFDGVLNAGVPEADFRFIDREIDMEMQKFILLVIDIVVQIATPYNNLRDALGNVVDCQGLGDEARDFAQNTLGLGLIPAIGIGALVEDQCNDILDDIVDGIGGIGVTWEAMDFDQLGHAVDRTPQDGRNRPEVLQMLNVQDTIDGRFRFAIQDPMGGRWEGLP